MIEASLEGQMINDWLSHDLFPVDVSEFVFLQDWRKATVVGDVIERW